MGELDGQIALITGIAAGMGTSIAEAFSEAGATVVGTDIDEPGGRAAMERLGPQASFTVGDVARVSETAGLIEQVVATHGRLDVLVNNAGVTKSLGFFDVTENDWDHINSVNNRGLFFLMQAAATAMRDAGTGGRIINIASIAGKGYRGTSNVAYAGTKGSVIAMTRISAQQLARFGINVNAICPGVTRTALFDQVIDELVDRLGGSREDAEARAVRSIPLRRANDPEDIASLAVYLASEAARNVTGQSWNVDGGLHWD
ncbi:MAG: NAD(P)-dependent dehydrogenase (short-subunit alcohol dehydrogenase family) [Acidimicrobiales bacterium]|jgi:NAD(P)-dependent dehydrogenase (short-subunit alcohol dehydrogenase family)